MTAVINLYCFGEQGIYLFLLFYCYDVIYDVTKKFWISRKSKKPGMLCHKWCLRSVNRGQILDITASDTEAPGINEIKPSIKKGWV